ncbi:MAG TPA: glycosyltransferase family 4 protein [Lacunisphaera sp.]|nr:glycosyltransferase family 4 protein [Lacunisphaera sp.]
MKGPATSRIHGEIESPRPLRAREGLVSVTGWCLQAGVPQPPAVRLVTGGGILPASRRIIRNDVPGQAAPSACGFVIEGRLPPGTYVARFEAQLPSGGWAVFKTLTLAVEARPFAADVEFPPPGQPLDERVFVEGWALHPRQPVRKLTLRYGRQEIPCDLGRPRADVPLAYPEVPHAARSGFRSRVILWAGRGPLRLRAELDDGSIAVAHTGREVDVARDEHTDARVEFGAPRIPLPGYVPRPPSPPVPAPTGWNVLFVSHGDFTANSSLQISALARELAFAGHSSAVAVPQDLDTLAYQQTPPFRGLLHAEAIATGGGFPNGRGPDVIHAWTTRESVRATALAVRAKFGGRLVVQLEDNEQEIRQQNLATGAAASQPLDLTDPAKGQAFLEAADGITLIVDSLAKFVPAGKPHVTIWPAADARYFHARPVPAEFRAALQLPADATLLFYHGNVHAANAAEMRELYDSLLRLNDAGQPTYLIRAGADQVDFLGPLAARVKPFVLDLGTIHHHRHLPPLMALADIFVQPGTADAFNDFRFPSKLPEFFALGRPVILPRTNLGAHLRHGTDAWVLDCADAAGIAGAVTALRQDGALRERLGAGALAFAAQHFSWRRSAEALAKFYGTLATS